MSAAVVPIPTRSLASTLAGLTKLPISSASTCTAAAGYVAYLRGVDTGLITTLLGTLLLAMGSSALNEFQERHLDARMPRTRHRPIPRGDLTPAAALTISFGLALAGFLVLLALSWTTALLGTLAVAWYNGFYTPLKRVSAFAVVPGALIGALPPAIGWTAAGGHPLDPAILALSFVFFIWQVPHFWLLVVMHAEGYEQAGFPTLVKLFGRQRVARLIFTWLCGTAAACALLPVFRLTTTWPSLALLVGAAIWLVAGSTRLLRPVPSQARFRTTFLTVNLFALALAASVILDPFIAP